MKPIVTDATAKMLYELGYNEKTNTHKYITEEDINKNITVIEKPYVLDAWWWLQQNTEFRISIEYDKLLDNYSCCYYYDCDLKSFDSDVYDDFADAVSECLDYIATNGYYKNL